MSRLLRNILLILVILIFAFSFFKLEKRVLQSDEVLEELSSDEIALINVENKTIQSVYRLSSHFPDEFIPVVFEEPETVVEEVVERGPIVSTEWKFVSTIVQSDTPTYYFKSNRSNRLLELVENKDSGDWTLVSIENDHFILKFEESLYKVYKK